MTSVQILRVVAYTVGIYVQLYMDERSLSSKIFLLLSNSLKRNITSLTILVSQSYLRLVNTGKRIVYRAHTTTKITTRLQLALDCLATR